MQIRRLMDAAVGVVRTEASLAQVVVTLGRLASGRGWFEPGRDAASAALLIAAAALQRTESRGAHHRRDHPDTASEWARPTWMTLADARSLAAALDPEPDTASAA